MKLTRLFCVFLLLSSCAAAPTRAPSAKRLPPEKEQAEYDAGLVDWNNLKAGQDKPCDEKYDSREHLMGHKTKVAVVILHGFSQNPERVSVILRSSTRVRRFSAGGRSRSSAPVGDVTDAVVFIEHSPAGWWSLVRYQWRCW